MKNLSKGDWVLVNGSLVGTVEYMTADGWVGVAMVNEKGRVDEWTPESCQYLTPREAACIVAIDYPGFGVILK